MSVATPSRRGRTPRPHPSRAIRQQALAVGVHPDVARTALPDDLRTIVAAMLNRPARLELVDDVERIEDACPNLAWHPVEPIDELAESDDERASTVHFLRSRAAERDGQPAPAPDSWWFDGPRGGAA